MNRRNTLKLVASLPLLALAGAAVAQAPAANVTTISPRQPGGTKGQIEVIEFFSYGCPHCANLDPILTKWIATLPKDVSFVRVPVSFGRPEWAALGRLYLTLNELNLNARLDPLVFDAVQKSRIRLDDEKIRNDWLAKQGVDIRKFNDFWRSFTIDTYVKRDELRSIAYKVQGVPALAINGRFMVDGEGEATVKMADQLIQRVRSGK